VDDFDGDGKPDIFLGGNFYGLKPEVGRMDASYGTTLMGNGSRGFNYLAPRSSGLFIQGEVRDIRPIVIRNSKDIIVARNNDELQIFEPSRNSQRPKGK
jgi:enediyne biosynthesis protein E4